MGSSVHIQTVIRSLLFLLLFFGEFVVLGAIFLTWCDRRVSHTFNLLEQALLGFCIASGFAQIWSLFGGLFPFSNLVLFGLAISLALLQRGAFVRTLREGLSATRKPNLIVFGFFALAISYNALTSGLCYDNNLYHFLAVRWAAEYGTVPGLANLHGRLGFNSSLTALAGLLGAPFKMEIGREFANAVTTLMACGVVSQGLRFSFRELGLEVLYCLGLFTFLVSLALSPCLSSPQPDIASAALVTTAAWYFLQLLSSKDLQWSAKSLVLCAGSAIAATELKLSYVCLSAVTLILAAGRMCYLVIKDGGTLRLWLQGGKLVSRLQNWSLIPWVLLGVWTFIPWLVCGYVTSGYPLFPSDFAGWNFDWAVPPDQVALERNSVIAWARLPGSPIAEALGSWAWVASWFIRLLASPFVLICLLLSVIGLFALVVFGLRRTGKLGFNHLLILAPAASGLLFWFVTAPDPRFAQATIWLFALNLLIIPAVASGDLILANLVVFILCSIAAFGAVTGVQRLVKEKKMLPNYIGAYPELSARRTSTGLTVWVPKTVYEPGAGELVATPPDRFDSELELRGESLRNGFRRSSSDVNLTAKGK